MPHREATTRISVSSIFFQSGTSLVKEAKVMSNEHVEHVVQVAEILNNEEGGGEAKHTYG